MLSEDELREAILLIFANKQVTQLLKYNQNNRKKKIYLSFSLT
jgi:hypothetical protein